MDYRRINSHIILLGMVIVVGLFAAIIVRLFMLERGADGGTANLIFMLILGASAILYLIIVSTLSNSVIPWIMKRLPAPKKKAGLILPIDQSEDIDEDDESDEPERAQDYSFAYPDIIGYNGGYDMSRPDFDTFKQHLREWMESHSGEYDAFEAGMNRRDDAGYQMILAVAMGLAPEYEKIVSRHVNRGPDGDISEIERLFTESNLAETMTDDGLGSDLTANLLGDFEDIRKESIVPAMLCWLYFGQSFERMVERGEELRRSPEIPYYEKMLIVQTIKMLVDQSIELGLRTNEDWKRHHSLIKLADSDDTFGWVLTPEEPSAEKKKSGRPSTAGMLVEMFAPAVRNKKKLTDKMGEYLTTKHSQSDIARLRIALDELRFLASPVTIKSFRDALAEQFAPGIHIVHERGIQEAYSRLTSFVTIKDVRVMVANREEDRAAIDELTDFLRR